MQEANLSLTLHSWCPNFLRFARKIRKANKLMDDLYSLTCLHSCLALLFYWLCILGQQICTVHTSLSNKHRILRSDLKECSSFCSSWVSPGWVKKF